MPATPRFIWFPSSTIVRYSQLSQPITEIQEWEVRAEQLTDTMGGARVALQTLGYRAVQIRSEMVSDLADVRELEALINHLANRHVIAFQEDDLVNFGTWAVLLPRAGATSILTLGLMFPTFGPAFVQAGDVHVIHGRTPDGTYIREEAVVSSWDGATITYTSGLINDYTGGEWCFIRDKRFHPWLRLRRDGLSRSLLTHDGRITWTLDLPLEEVPQAIGIIGQTGGTLDVEISPTGTYEFFGGGGYGGLS